MNTKPIPITITLIASLVACVISIIEGVEFSVFVLRFGLTALIFYMIGSIIRVILDRNIQADKEEEEEQMEVDLSEDSDETSAENTTSSEEQ